MPTAELRMDDALGNKKNSLPLDKTEHREDWKSSKDSDSAADLKTTKDWNQVMGAHIQVGDLQSAHDTLNIIRLASYKPDVYSYSRLLTAFDRENSFDKFEMVIKELNESDLKWTKLCTSIRQCNYTSISNLGAISEVKISKLWTSIRQCN